MVPVMAGERPHDSHGLYTQEAKSQYFESFYHKEMLTLREDKCAQTNLKHYTVHEKSQEINTYNFHCSCGCLKINFILVVNLAFLFSHLFSPKIHFKNLVLHRNLMLLKYLDFLIHLYIVSHTKNVHKN